jgi:ATP-dependent RNA helicase DDX52/ROK1
MQAVPALLAGRDILAAAPTGSGKTAAYCIPLISKLADGASGQGVRALVIAPTRELADQIHRELLRLSTGLGRRLKTCLLKKSHIAAAAAKQDASALSRFDVVVSTPMRLLFLMRAGGVDLSTVRTVVLDEVDKLFEVEHGGGLGETGGGTEGDEGGDEVGRSSFLTQMDEILAQCSAADVQRCLFR